MADFSVHNLGQVAIFRIKCINREEGGLEQGWKISKILEACQNAKLCGRYILTLWYIESSDTL
jgi:hypothetical protein